MSILRSRICVWLEGDLFVFRVPCFVFLCVTLILLNVTIYVYTYIYCMWPCIRVVGLPSSTTDLEEVTAGDIWYLYGDAKCVPDQIANVKGKEQPQHYAAADLAQWYFGTFLTILVALNRIIVWYCSCCSTIMLLAYRGFVHEKMPSAFFIQ